LIDVEEITQKAGNYKTFEIFIKMLNSAISKESESVFIDLLTYSDLEQLKARKSSQASQVTNSVTLNKSQNKRYIILTYSSEFDRVHYPLPLCYEETPNPEALLKTIRRLRNQLNEIIEVNSDK
jgi:coiled-coil domain-containing protein 61